MIAVEHAGWSEGCKKALPPEVFVGFTTIADYRTCSGRSYNDSDIDLIGGSGQESSSNKDGLTGKGQRK
jgi:hypothetical protein